MTRVVTLLVLAIFAALPARAETWPSKDVKLIVPFAAGATPDIVARVLADTLQAKLGQTFVVENKPGASGNLGTDAVAKALATHAVPQGRTLVRSNQRKRGNRRAASSRQKYSALVIDRPPAAARAAAWRASRSSNAGRCPATSSKRSQCRFVVQC